MRRATRRFLDSDTVCATVVPPSDAGEFCLRTSSVAHLRAAERQCTDSRKRPNDRHGADASARNHSFARKHARDRHSFCPQSRARQRHDTCGADERLEEPHMLGTWELRCQR
jgi:hypothetical protein